MNSGLFSVFPLYILRRLSDVDVRANHNFLIVFFRWHGDGESKARVMCHRHRQGACCCLNKREESKALAVLQSSPLYFFKCYYMAPGGL